MHFPIGPGRCLAPILTFAVLVCAAAAARGADPALAQSRSAEQVELLRRVVRETLAQTGLDASAETIVQNVRNTAAFQALPSLRVAPEIPPVTDADCRQAAAAAAVTLAGNKYPGFDAAAARAEAEAKYPLHRVGDVVSVIYRPNPTRILELHDIYQGRTKQTLRIGGRSILIRDIAVSPENQDELIKFDRERTLQLRTEYLAKQRQAYEAERTAYEQKVRELLLQSRLDAATTANETAGYLSVNGAWYAPEGALEILAEEQRVQLRLESAAAATVRRQDLTASLGVAVASREAFEALAPAVAYTDPESLTALRPKPPPLPETEATAPEQTGPDSEQEPEPGDDEPAAALAETPAAVADAASEAKADTVPSVPVWVYIAIGVGVVAVIVLVVVFIVRAEADKGRLREKPDKLQRSFWALVDADPAHVKYVSFTYPTEETAKAALLSLSFIRLTEDGHLQSDEALRYGYYPEKDRVITFVGGTQMTYAQWREASAVLPEVAGAEYCRVSTAPDVEMSLPDVETLRAEDDLDIQHLNSREGEGEDYTHYHTYHAPSREQALAFLDKVNVGSDGVQVMVETPEGTFGKDSGGVYEAEAAE